MHSPDRRYGWDGSKWSLAVSPDGRLWFDGQRWVPNPLRPPARRRAPTRWTRPLQELAIAVAVLGFGLFVGAVPFRLEQIGALPPPALPPSAGVSPGEAERIAQVARSVAIGSLVIEGLIGLVLLVLIVVGALRRWRWAFWLALVLNGLGGLGLVMGALLGGLLLAGPGLPPPR